LSYGPMSRALLPVATWKQPANLDYIIGHLLNPPARHERPESQTIYFSRAAVVG